MRRPSKDDPQTEFDDKYRVTSVLLEIGFLSASCRTERRVCRNLHVIYQIFELRPDSARANANYIPPTTTSEDMEKALETDECFASQDSVVVMDEEELVVDESAGLGLAHAGSCFLNRIWRTSTIAHRNGCTNNCPPFTYAVEGIPHDDGGASPLGDGRCVVVFSNGKRCYRKVHPQEKTKCVACAAEYRRITCDKHGCNNEKVDGSPFCSIHVFVGVDCCIQVINEKRCSRPIKNRVNCRCAPCFNNYILPITCSYRGCYKERVDGFNRCFIHVLDDGICVEKVGDKRCHRARKHKLSGRCNDCYEAFSAIECDKIGCMNTKVDDSQFCFLHTPPDPANQVAAVATVKPKNLPPPDTSVPCKLCDFVGCAQLAGLDGKWCATHRRLETRKIREQRGEEANDSLQEEALLLRKEAVTYLKVWVAEHPGHYYPNDQEMKIIVKDTRLTWDQVKQWFGDYRTRLSKIQAEQQQSSAGDPNETTLAPLLRKVHPLRYYPDYHRDQEVLKRKVAEDASNPKDPSGLGHFDKKLIPHTELLVSHMLENENELFVKKRLQKVSY
jgi:Homeobox KN domain